MQLTYVVAWTNGNGHEVKTEVVVRADNNSDGRMLADQAAAESAISALDGREVAGRDIRVNEARPREERPRNAAGPRRPRF